MERMDRSRQGQEDKKWKQAGKGTAEKQRWVVSTDQVTMKNAIIISHKYGLRKIKGKRKGMWA